jgi:hypothetical protein
MNCVDIWGHNAYAPYDYHCYFWYYDKITAKPLIVTEYGADAYDKNCSCENQAAQAEWVVHEWGQIEENCLGGTVMAYSDEWWKCGFPDSNEECGYDTYVQPDGFSHEEWYGIMSLENNGSSEDIMHPREVYCALQQAFSERACLGDLDTDGDVDFYDFDVFACRWKDTNCYEDNCCGGGADFNHDGTVGMKDLDMFAEDWLCGL